MVDAPPPPAAAAGAPWWRGVLTVLVKVAIGVVIAYLVLSFVRSIDWAEVGDALGRLRWWELLVMALLIAIRQTANASPLVFLLPGLGLPHAVSNGLSGTLIATFTPPPSDIVLRMSMLTSWGIETDQGGRGAGAQHRGVLPGPVRRPGPRSGADRRIVGGGTRLPLDRARRCDGRRARSSGC